MRSPTYDLSISTVRADALFASPLQRWDNPSPAQVDQAIAAAFRALGASGCAARVAQAYGERPETAVIRMRWARATSTGVLEGTGMERGRLVPGQHAARPACRTA